MVAPASVANAAADSSDRKPVAPKAAPHVVVPQVKRTPSRPPVRAPRGRTRSGSSRKSEPVAPQDALRLRIELIEARIEPAKAVDLDLGPDWAARPLAKLLEGLSELGTASLRYRFDSQIVVGERLEVASGGKIPWVSKMRKLEGGKVASNVEYEEIGCIVGAEASWLEAKADNAPRFVRLELNLEVGALRPETSIEIAPGRDAPIFNRHEENHATILRLGQPALLTTYAAREITPKTTPLGETLIWRIQVDPAAVGPAAPLRNPRSARQE